MRDMHHEFSLLLSSLYMISSAILVSFLFAVSSAENSDHSGRETQFRLRSDRF